MIKNRLPSLYLILKPMLAIAAAIFILLPINVSATQLHASSEGVITHQMGHIFFLFSMLVLIFTVTDKGLNKQKGWRLIQCSAFFFILWNLDAITAHFFDNQIHAVKIENISIWKMRIITNNDSSLLAWFYYMLKLDHLLCVPAMLFLYKGLSNLLDVQKQVIVKKDNS
ncbi:MAG: hypothetical protein H8D87_20855 [Deltaproteobacteria bacterium]|uniref:hypothetical protein n=1 Tax=Desulfobacula sp. TaxID=2593537 RepID=UPI0019CA3C7D|nr:hypothetical protein [Candidatus Desulfobacula maris]MBL6992844.1 hypothetical protein [Desulfobacula sp.]